MKNSHSLEDIIKKLRHYLPSQAPLKDFIHHNTLHAFQDLHFFEALEKASRMFGYKVTLSLSEYRNLFFSGQISHEWLHKSLLKYHKVEEINEVRNRLLYYNFEESQKPLIGMLRAEWKASYSLDLNTIVHSNLFRIINHYLDQGIAMMSYPAKELGLIQSLRKIESNTWVSLFKTKKAQALLLDENVTVEKLLELIVGDSAYWELYLFDQQFAHPGWSGMVSVNSSKSSAKKYPIKLKELIHVELLLEYDALESNLKRQWEPICTKAKVHPEHLWHIDEQYEYYKLCQTWQYAFEWTYYDKVLFGIKHVYTFPTTKEQKTFQAFFCIDDRNCSIRRYIELEDPSCQTFGTPGHFGIDAYFLPYGAVELTKICPAPVTPAAVIKETVTTRKNTENPHIHNRTHGVFRGWIITQTLGFWAALQLLLNLFRPRLSANVSFSFGHMQRESNLLFENRSMNHSYAGFQVGYTQEEMAVRVENVLRTAGLIENFAPLVYMIGHGSSSVNNTYYAGYDCGACSGRPGSVNSRVFCHMANSPAVRQILIQKEIVIPDSTEFLAGLHDTCRDEIVFYDEENLSPANNTLHETYKKYFETALVKNAGERSRRMETLPKNLNHKKIHEQIKSRSFSLFEPRPELNHATNALCLVGSSRLHTHLFLDRRAFIYTYEPYSDISGDRLMQVLLAAVPVCGGINLEYYFSRVDPERLGAGSKLPHNVMGLLGVANGFEGDLKTGLPTQMTEIHSPLRMLFVIEQEVDTVHSVIQKSNQLKEWFGNEWINLAVISPSTTSFMLFQDNKWEPYESFENQIEIIRENELAQLFSNESGNLPVLKIY